MLLHLLGSYIFKVCAFHIGKQVFLISIQVTNEIGQTQSKGISFISRGQITL